MSEKKIKGYKILSLEARELYEHINSDTPYEISCTNEKGEWHIDFNKFTACIYDSLETDKLREFFPKHRDIGKFEIREFGSDPNGYGATLAVINVSFRKNGDIKKEELRRRLYDSEIRIVTKRHVGKNKTEKITENSYVRYKRSAGSSRDGNCLFILKELKRDMMKWSSCGLDEDRITDKVSWESYISLTLSNAIARITLPKESILFLPDAESTCEVDAVAVSKNENGDLTASPERVTVTNKIWDGQALLDESVFNSCERLNGKGMALLRNRFFKTCAFNTKLQKWFNDNGITDVDQLHPECFTLAENISDIKLVVTHSSLKSIKLMQSEKVTARQRSVPTDKEKTEKAIRLWLDQLEESFGVVKTDKPTKHFGGEKVQTSYQLINTLDLDLAELTVLTKPSHDYLSRIMNDPVYMRYFLQCELWDADSEVTPVTEYGDYGTSDGDADGDDSDSEDISEFSTMRKRVSLDLLSINDEYSKTKFYDEFRQQIRKDYLDKIKKGRLLVHGTNATLFGNGFEMLSAVTDQDLDLSRPVAITLSGSEVRSSFFPDGEEILCARSPHVTMGNLFVAKNKLSGDDHIARWFNLTNEIICVNSIGESLMDRLNGCDFDSDFMLITNDAVLLNAAKKHYAEFGVPVGQFEYRNENKEIYEIDTDISNNKIGEIINASQWLNSILWDKKAEGTLDTELYYDICKLAVLSGIEIDKAKRNYGISAETELKLITDKYKKGRYGERPSFMKKVKKQRFTKKYRPKKGLAKKIRKKAVAKKHTDNYQTAMQLLQRMVKNAPRKTHEHEKRTLSSFLQDIPPKEDMSNEYRYANAITELLGDKNQLLKSLRTKQHWVSQAEKRHVWEKIRAIESECVEHVKKRMKSEAVLKLLINRLDEGTKETKKVSSLLLSCICSANSLFFDRVSKDGQGNIRYEIVMDPSGDVDILGVRHSRILKS